MEQLPEDGQVGPKHIAVDVILMLFYIKERLWPFLNCIKDGGKWVSGIEPRFLDFLNVVHVNRNKKKLCVMYVRPHL
jgi:hypothetical protein